MVGSALTPWRLEGWGWRSCQRNPCSSWASLAKYPVYHVPFSAWCIGCPSCSALFPIKHALSQKQNKNPQTWWICSLPFFSHYLLSSFPCFHSHPLWQWINVKHSSQVSLTQRNPASLIPSCLTPHCPIPCHLPLLKSCTGSRLKSNSCPSLLAFLAIPFIRPPLFQRHNPFVSCSPYTHAFHHLWEKDIFSRFCSWSLSLE